MRNHQKAILLMLLFALAFAGCSSAKRQKAADISISGAQEEFPSVPETIPETDAPQEAELGIFKLSQPEAEEPNGNTFETTSVPALRAPENGETIELLETKAFGALTARYYACAPGTIESGAWTDFLETAAPSESAEMSVPEGLGFEPFSACANSSGTKILLCDYDPETGLLPVYDLYEDGKLTELNLNGGAPIDPERIRWYSDWELAYDVETTGGCWTTYL